MPRRHEPPEDLVQAPFARAAGIALVGASALRSAAYRPVVRGAHWVSGERLDQGRMIEAYRAVRPDDAVLGGWSAAWVHGLLWAPDEMPVVLPASLEDVVQLAARHPGSRGCRRAAEVLALVDLRAESPRESLLRVLLVQAGLPAPELQVEVMDGHRFVARLDLAWPELKRGMEYDGAHHREAEQHARDLRRHNDLRNLGWRVLQVDAEQFANPEHVIADARRLLST